MKKIKNVMYFLISIAITILVYVMILNNMVKLTLDYDDKILTYENKYKVENKEEKIKQYLTPIQTTSNYTEDEIHQMIFANKSINKMNQYLLNMKETEMKRYIQKASENSVITETKYGNIIYIKNNQYQLAYTNDLKNLYYCIATQGANIESDRENLKDIPEEISKSKEKVIERINIQLVAMELQAKTEFKADSIMIQRYLLGSNPSYHYIYVIEDIEKNMQVFYDVNSEKIKEIIIGFE